MATRTPKVLYQGQLPTSKTTLYTVPASTRTYITSIVGFNSNAASQTVVVFYNPGGTSRVAFRIGALAQNERFDYSGGDVLETGDLIEGITTTAAALDLMIFGIEET